MSDIVDKPTRSRMMSGIKGKDTLPELLIRKALHKRGFRYKLYDKTLPGNPDLVFSKHKAVVQIQGCFWHKHNCHLFKWPSTRKEFWKEKIQANAERDHKNLVKLHKTGWKTLLVWECAVKGKEKLPERELIRTIESWLLYDPMNAEITGRKKCSP